MRYVALPGDSRAVAHPHARSALAVHPLTTAILS